MIHRVIHKCYLTMLGLGDLSRLDRSDEYCPKIFYINSRSNAGYFLIFGKFQFFFFNLQLKMYKII